MIDKFLEGNKRFIEEDFSRDREYYLKIANKQTPTALFIGCSDSRVDPERVTGAKMGEIFVHRNIGNIVAKDDPNLGTVLEYAVEHLRVQDIVVYGHSDCGAMKALDAGEGGMYIGGWLEAAKGAKAKADAEKIPALTPARKKAIEIENMRIAIANLRTYPFVKKAEDEGLLTLHGLYYDLETGELSKVL
jgi:carbonic anhydrase